MHTFVYLSVFLLGMVFNALAYDTFDRNCVLAHNKYRKMHGADKLYWSETLAADAQTWVENLAQNDMIESDKSLKGSTQTESIHWLKPPKPRCQGKKTSKCTSCSEIVAALYKEGENYDYEMGKAKDEEKSIDRFARVIWNNTFELGVASAVSTSHGLITVIRYNPGGAKGKAEDFKRNIFAMKERDSETSETSDENINDDEEQTEEADVRAPYTNCPGNSGVGGGGTGGVMPISCGIGSSSRIVGGSIAAPGRWPWQVGFITFGITSSGNSYRSQIFCGGSLINREWVVTAAHCFPKDPPQTRRNTVKVILGEFDTKNKEAQEVLIDVGKVIQHQQFNSGTLDYDITLVKLKTPLKEYNRYIKPVCLPARQMNFPVGQKCYVTGFGALREGGNLATFLRQARVPIVSTRECSRNYKSDGVRITNRMICAGYPRNGGIDSCQGDSGGPLVCAYKGRYHLAGVVSFGIGCARKGKPGVYSRVADLRSWLDLNMKFN